MVAGPHINSIPVPVHSNIFPVISNNPSKINNYFRNATPTIFNFHQSSDLASKYPYAQQLTVQ